MSKSESSASTPLGVERIPEYFAKPGITEALSEAHPMLLVRQMANEILRLRASKSETSTPMDRRAIVKQAADRVMPGVAAALIGDAAIARASETRATDTPGEPNRDVSAGSSHAAPDGPATKPADVQGASQGSAPISLALRRGGFDQKCLNLAEFFVRDTGPYSSESDEEKRGVATELAQAIQDTIETFLQERGL